MSLMTQRTRAGVPSEVMQLVARRRQLAPADHLTVGRRLGVTVDDGHRIVLLALGVERRYIRELLGRSRGRGGRRPIEGGIRTRGHRIPRFVDRKLSASRILSRIG